MRAVLLIEDDPVLRAALCALLEDAGYHMIEAVDGVSGLAILQASQVPLVVLLDHRLPYMKGCDLFELVKREPALQRHAYVYMTAARPHEIACECDTTPADVGAGVVYKPFDIDALLDAVAAAEGKLAAAV
jgi:two-component system chemotaxis response regulator CheY